MSGCGCNNNQKGGGSKGCSCKKCRRSMQRGGGLWQSLFGSSEKVPTSDLGTPSPGLQEPSGPSVSNQGQVEQVRQQGGKRKTRKTRKTRRVKKSRKYRR